MDPEKWLVEWFSDNSSISREELVQNKETDYLGDGWIDSMQFIRLISGAEEEFDIEFANDEFQDRAFATISGLASIIEEKTGGNES